MVQPGSAARAGTARVIAVQEGAVTVAILVPIAAGLVGALVGAAAAWFAGRVQHRLETTFAMHREFHSPEMTRSRNLAGQTVRDNRSSSFEDMRVRLSPEVTQHVWNVMYFYQRLCLAVKLRDVHRSYIPEMFGENFCWWYSRSYEHQLVPLNWQAGRHIKWLMNWIEDSAPADELQKWRTRAAAIEDPRPASRGMLSRWRQLRRMLLSEPLATIPARACYLPRMCLPGNPPGRTAAFCTQIN